MKRADRLVTNAIREFRNSMKSARCPNCDSEMPGGLAFGECGECGKLLRLARTRELGHWIRWSAWIQWSIVAAGILWFLLFFSLLAWQVAVERDIAKWEAVTNACLPCRKPMLCKELPWQCARWRSPRWLAWAV